MFLSFFSLVYVVKGVSDFETLCLVLCCIFTFQAHKIMTAALHKPPKPTSGFQNFSFPFELLNTGDRDQFVEHEINEEFATLREDSKVFSSHRIIAAVSTSCI